MSKDESERDNLLLTQTEERLARMLKALGNPHRVHLGFPHPAKASGTEEEVMAMFRAVRDDIGVRVPAMLVDGTER